MEKINILDLKNHLVDKHGVSESDAQSFINDMNELLRTTLLEEGMVKLRGLGTFKLIDVDSRESINVNTGERVLINSHSKLSFSPDTAMRELINRPFSQFQTVILNEGVSFGNEEEEENAIQEPTTIVAEEQPTVENAPVTEEEPSMAEEIPAVKEEAPAVEEPTVTIDAEVSIVDNEPITEAEEPEMVEEPTVTINAEVSIVDNEPITEAEEPEMVEEEPTAEEKTNTDDNLMKEDASGEEEEQPEDEEQTTAIEEEAPKRHSAVRYMLYATSILLLMLVSAYGGYRYAYYEQEGAKAVAGTPIPNTTVKQQAPEPSVEKATPAVPDTLPSTAQPSTPTEEVAELAPTESSLDIYEQRDARVRTGAYRIVGTLREVKVERGETLARIARRYLGEGMNCYVEVYNDLTADTPLKEGQIIKIPQVELKKKKKR
ncbi:MAG: HU family DNA-binding protein [Prevotella sp.]|nr:HU family DNA-binding protein [Prevotella sp.]